MEQDRLEDLDSVHLTSYSTNLIILEKFVKDFEVCLNGIFNQNKNVMISFEDFARIFYELGFVKILYDAKLNINEEDDLFKSDKDKQSSLQAEHPDIRIQRFRRKNETSCLKDAWKILTGGSPDLDKIDSNQLIVFCASILGLYQGDDPNASRASLAIGRKQFKLNNVDSDATMPIRTEKSLSPIKSPLKSILKTPKTFRLTTIGGSPMSKMRRNESQSTTRHKKEKILLKVVIPDLNLERFSYHPITVKQIHSIFHQLFNNRAEYIIESKKRELMKNSSKSESNLLNDQFNYKFSLDEKTKKSAANYRSKLYTVSLQN